jgi:cation diffusion facilitator CzcD-associated flavoprotein CzcO
LDIVRLRFSLIVKMATRVAKIQRSQKHGGDTRIYYPVAIIGAGVAGIAMACRLKQKLGFDQFRIFESSAGIGVRTHEMLAL